jgi:hypothetical protein
MAPLDATLTPHERARNALHDEFVYVNAHHPLGPALASLFPPGAAMAGTADPGDAAVAAAHGARALYVRVRARERERGLMKVQG